MPTTHDYLEKTDRLAVMGGTFDPIHNGHIAVAEAVLHEFAPRRVLFVPCGQSSLKSQKPTDGEHRYAMTLAAISENPAFDASRMEIDRAGISYTVDTLSALREICPPGAEISFIIGADALMDILKWRGAEKLLTLCEFIAVHRPGYTLDNIYVETLRKKGAKIHIFEGPALEISGTSIRKDFAEGKPVSSLMPKAAEEYARAHGLYCGGAELSDVRFAAVRAQIEKILTPHRFKHTLGTVIEAEKLAAHYGADIKKARWAALLHDCAKEFSADKKRTLCEMWGIPTDDFSEIDVAHGAIGAEVARRTYRVTDPEILQAIARHTIGGEKMTLPDKIIMLADYIEPYREDYYPLEEIRRHAYTDINRAIIIGLESEEHELHPATKAAIRDMRKENAK